MRSSAKLQRAAAAAVVLQELGGLTAATAVALTERGEYSLGVGFHLLSLIHVNLPVPALYTAKPQIALIHEYFFIEIQGFDAEMAEFEVAILGIWGF